MALPHVYTLTWCQRPQLLYGNTLLFKTLRTGFPNARIHVTDGGSEPGARKVIRELALESGALFVQLERHVELYDYLHYVVARQREGAAVFVDPDVCFWSKIEEWDFGGLAAGRFIPRHLCDFTGCLTEPRLHTSLFWIPDVARLRNKIAEERQRHRYFEPFRCTMVNIAGAWHFCDNTAGLYSAFPEGMCAFAESQLDQYDHLFCGAFSDSVLSKLGLDFRPVFAGIHGQAQENIFSIKGCWRQQERYFQSRSHVDQIANKSRTVANHQG